MFRKIVSGISLALLLIGVLTSAFNLVTLKVDGVASTDRSSLASSEPPATEWWATYGGSELDEAHCVVQTSDGGYAIVGETESFGSGDKDFWLIKIDSTGNMKWNKTFGGADWDEARSIVQTTDGGYAIAGFTYSVGAGNSDFVVVKTDSVGNKQWSRTYGGSYSEEAYSIVQTSDGGYAIAGYTSSFGPFYDNFWLVKTNSTGYEEWDRWYSGGDLSFQYAYSLVQTGDGGYAMAGLAYLESSPLGGYDAWLVKTDSAGYMEWNRYGGGTADDVVYSIVQTNDGGYGLAGFTNSFGAGGDDFWLVKTNSTGYGEWSKTYGGAWIDVAYSLVHTRDGGYVVAGSTLSFGAGYDDFWVVKTDSAGNMVWNKTGGGSGYDEAYSIVQTSDDGYAMAGCTHSFGAGSADFVVVKYAREALAQNLIVDDVVVDNRGCTVYANDTYADGTAYYVPVGITVENVGDLDAGSFNVSLTVYWTNGSLQEDYLEWRVLGLNAGENTTLTYDWRPMHTGYYNLTALVDCGGEVAESDESDNALVVSEYPVALIGDVNGDHTVGIVDAVIVSLAWASHPGDPTWNIKADLNHDGVIGIGDGVRIGLNWAKTW